MMTHRSYDNYGKAELAARYIELRGQDILEHSPSEIPFGWTSLVVDLFNQLRAYHPGTTITSMHLTPILDYSPGRFAISFHIPSRSHNSDDTQKLSHSLKWLVKSSKQKAFNTCSVCGHQLGDLRHNNLCPLCACRSGIKEFK